MKKGWTYKKLGEVCNIIGGGTPDKKNHSFYNGLIPWATVRDMNCEVLSSTEFSITEDGLNNSASHIIKKGEIIIATRVGLGKICKLAQDTAINQDLKGIIPKKEIIDRGFLYYYFKDKAKYIESNGVGATVKGVKLKFIEDLPFPLIGIHEQKKIVERLDAAFAQIDELKANAEKQLAEARALFQKALAKAMEPKKGWEEKKLKDIVLTITDGDHQPPPKSSDGIPFITISNIDKESNKIDFEDTFHVPQTYFNGLKSDKIPQQGDVLYTVTGSFGIPVLIDYKKDFCFQRHIALIRPNQKLLFPEFLYYWILSDYAKAQAEDTATGAAQRTVSLNSLRKFNISIPPLSEQQRIVKRLDSISENVRKYEDIQLKIIAECDALKQALLRQVFE